MCVCVCVCVRVCVHVCIYVKEKRAGKEKESGPSEARVGSRRAAVYGQGESTAADANGETVTSV